MNGRYASIRWSYEKGAFIGDENIIQNSYMKNFDGPKDKQIQKSL